MNDTSTINKLKGVTHVWPHSRLINPEAQPFSDEREAHVWEELRGLTFNNIDLRGSLAVLTSTVLQDDRDSFLNRLKKDDVAISRVKFFPTREVELKIHRPATQPRSLQSLRCIEEEFTYGLNGWEELPETSPPIEAPAKLAREETCKERIPFHLGSKLDAETVIKQHRNHELSTLVLWYPDEIEDLEYLSMVKAACPELPIYIFHADYREDKWGVEREVEGENWETEIIPLADCKLEPQEVIVDDLLIKGNIHVVAGRFEAYKTMALLEWSSAILDERPVHDHFKVLRRYPIIYLCADMSPELLAEYAGLFNLQKHGKDFRVRKPKGEIIHAVDSPVIQRAVAGRILILDTMLDFANIKEAFQSAEWITFMQKLRTLMTAHGCIAVIMTAHATKTGAKATTIDPSEYLKDSATFGGKIDVGYGFRKIENTSQVLIERIKGRGFKKGLQFTITVNNDDGESYLDRGRFPVCQKPGEVKLQRNSTGRPIDPEKQQKLDFLRSAEGSLQDKTDLMNAKFNSKHVKGTVGKWVNEIEFDSEVSA
jgi:hypothetical protein